MPAGCPTLLCVAVPLIGAQLTDVSPAMSTWPSAIRRGAIMAALLAIGTVTGNFDAGIAATTGALNIALMDAAVPRAVLARALWLCVGTTTVVGFLAVIVGDSWWLIPFLAVLAFLQGALAGAGLAVANATIASMITAILFSVVPGSFQDAAQLAGWLLLGALIEVTVALLAWRWERQGLVRRQVGMALAARAAGDPAAVVQRWVEAARTTMGTAELTPAERVAFDRLLTAVSDDRPAAADDLATAGRRVRRLPTRGHPAGRFGELVTALNCAPAVIDRPTCDSLRRQLGQLRGFLTPGTATFSAGVRLGVLMTVGALLVQLFEIPQGHWVLLVFTLAIRADYSGTMTVLLARALGVVAGVAAISAVVAVTGGSAPALVALAFVAAVMTCRWLLGNATLFFLWLTIFVSILVDIAAPDSCVGWQRVIATLIGVAIGVVGSLVWPGWRTSTGSQVPVTEPR